MKNTLLFVALLAAATMSHAASYTYRGSLQDGGKPADGQYDVQLSVTDANQRALAAPVTLYGVKVSKGQFSAEVEFGVDLAQYAQVQLHAAVRQGNGAFEALDRPTEVDLKNTQGAMCWEVGGNTGIPSGAAAGTNAVTDSPIMALRSRGDDILYVRGTSGGIEQNGSTANGTGAAAWIGSTANGPGSFTVGTGLTTANANNSVVFADGTAGTFQSASPNQFMVRADGGVMFNTGTFAANDDLVIATRPSSGDADVDLVLRTRSGKIGRFYVKDSDNAFTLSVQPTGANFLETTANGAKLTAGGSWTNGSSRLFKQGFAAIDPSEVLSKVVSLPITRWTYRNSTSEGEHIGPMAEDFHAAFRTGEDEQHIATVDADGVALAAIQGLNAKLEAENAELKARLAAIEAQLGLAR
ncbi:MAG: tail fiber domain-containing protein [Rhodanobacteraceae bacterium]|nr:tail fiber domain-containing protein [Rhodanobacteraceae bacterium]